jgi:hypothetical protein
LPEQLPEIIVVQELAKQFNRIVKEKKVADFDSWADCQTDVRTLFLAPEGPADISRGFHP